jgi:hypothetical protein
LVGSSSSGLDHNSLSGTEDNSCKDNVISISTWNEKTYKELVPHVV